MKRLQYIHYRLMIWGHYRAYGSVVSEDCSVTLCNTPQDDLKLNNVEFNALQLQKVLLTDQAIKTLRKADIRVLVGVYVLNMKQSDVARKLCITPRTVQIRLCRADRLIASFLGEREV